MHFGLRLLSALNAQIKKKKKKKKKMLETHDHFIHCPMRNLCPHLSHPGVRGGCKAGTDLFQSGPFKTFKPIPPLITRASRLTEINTELSFEKNFEVH